MVVILKEPVKLMKIKETLENQLLELKKLNTHLTLINEENIKEEDIIKE